MEHVIGQNGYGPYNENPFAFDLIMHGFDLSSGDLDYQFDAKTKKLKQKKYKQPITNKSINARMNDEKKL